MTAPGDEIWVQAGTYLPTTGADRVATFSLKSGVALYGGFLGTETSREQRDWAANATALSGDIGVVGDISDNSYHVVTGSGTDATAILDGFTITLGNANGANPYNRGAGMVNTNGSPTLTNIIFSGNSAYYGNGLGGGMANLDHSNPSLAGLMFRDNTALRGGGMYNHSSDPTITNAIFNTNSASGDGGGMYNYTSNPTMVNVTFSDNTARSLGGGLTNEASSPTLTEVTFSNNSADLGGGMHIDGGEPVLVGVEFKANHASTHAGSTSASTATTGPWPASSRRPCRRSSRSARTRTSTA